MNRLLAVAAATVAVSAAAALPAHADPKAEGGLQTSVCDNGETYVFTVRETGNTDRSQAFWHAPVHDPASNAVLVPVSGHGTVTISGEGESFSFPYDFDNPNRAADASGRLTTCQSTFDMEFPDGSVHVEGTDVVLVSGRH